MCILKRGSSRREYVTYRDGGKCKDCMVESDLANMMNREVSNRSMEHGKEIIIEDEAGKAG